MKSKVKLSTFSTILTCAVIILLLIGVVSSWGEDKSIIIAIILMAIIAASLFFYPKSIEANDSSLIIHRQFNSISFDYSDIASVDRCYPSAGGLRLCGSGGFFGYWGYFTDIVIGNYIGFYGNRSQCMLVKLKSGTQYVLSCENPDKMVEFLNEKIDG